MYKNPILNIQTNPIQMHKIQVYMAKFHKDKPLLKEITPPDWVTPIQAGASLTTERVAAALDCEGENISCKNANYCELTVLYWMWKNCLSGSTSHQKKYYGLFHYRRWLDIRDQDLQRIYNKNVDVVLPYPTVHEPDIREHYARYISDSDWHAVLQALKELAPAYYNAYDRIFSQEYLYNYNILIAKTEVLEKYCEWLFPILERVEMLSVPKGNERADRYIGYIGENLLTLYFLFHKKDLNIACTGRVMLL